MEAKNLIRIVTEKFKRHRSSPGHNVKRDWFIMLFIGLAMFAVIVVGCWQFNRFISSDTGNNETLAKQTISINRGTLEQVLNFYKNEEKLFNETKNSSVGVGDPMR